MKRILLYLNIFLIALFCCQDSALSVARLYDRQTGDIIDADKDDAEFDNTNSAINTHTADTSAHDATGGVVGVSKSQTLTNKTLTSPVITTAPTAAGATWVDLGTSPTLDLTTSLDLFSGADIFVYSSATATDLKWKVDGATGDTTLYSGADLKVYSDTGSTLNAQIDGATGDALLAPRANGAYGLSLALSGGTLTVNCRNAACSASNPGFVVMNSTTAGQQVTLKVTGSDSFNDDSHASSDLTNFGFGVTESVAWAQDVPFFLYVVNRGNAAIDGSDGNSKFFLARNPAMQLTPSTAARISDTVAVSATDDQHTIMILGSVTEANYVSLPVELIGTVRMQWSTVTDDWTVQTLGQSDGIGESNLKKQFATQWTFPGGQNGAITTAGGTNNYATHLSVSGGDLANDVPTWATNANIYYYYYIREDGSVRILHGTISAGNCTNGDVNADLFLVLPTLYSGTSNVNFGTSEVVSETGLLPTTGSYLAGPSSSTGIINATDFISANYDFRVDAEYLGFDSSI